MAFEIQPSHAAVTSKEAVRFLLLRDGKVASASEWSTSAPGGIRDGIYTAEPFILFGRTYVVSAIAEDGTVATATIETVAAHTWIPMIWFYLVGMVLVCAWGIRGLWPGDAPPQPAPAVAGPAVVTLKKGDSQEFTSNAEIKWDGLKNGIYVSEGVNGAKKDFAPAGGTGQDEARVSVVESEKVTLTLAPGYVEVQSGKAVTFTATLALAAAGATAEGKAGGAAEGKAGGAAEGKAGDATEGKACGAAEGKAGGATEGKAGTTPTTEDMNLVWDAPATGTGTTGTYTAPATVDKPLVVRVRVRTKNPEYTAEARVLLMPRCGRVLQCSSGWDLMMLAWFAGALGALLHGINSFAAYVGSRKFLSSWGVYYLARPLVGGLMGVALFLVFRSNLVGDGEKVDAASLYSVVTIAFLAGLFADLAVGKLKQVAEVLFGSGADARTDKLPNKAGTDPTISKLVPDKLAVGSPIKPVKIAGTNFADGANVMVNGVARVAAFVSAAELTFLPTAGEVAAAGTLKVKVVVNGKESNEVPLVVV